MRLLSTGHIAAAILAVGAFSTPLAAQAGRGLGIDTTNFDRSVRPQDDFYRFVNGGWLTRTPMPDNATRWGAFNELGESSKAALHDILETASRANAPAGSEQRKLGDLYASYMDSARIESLGIAPLQGELQIIAGLTASNQLAPTVARLARVGVAGPFSVSVGPDQMHSTVNLITVGQGSLGLPDRDYYLKDDAKSVATREAYKGYITRLLTLAKQPDPAGASSRILALETSIAQIQWDRVRSRDRTATYNKMSPSQLAAASPAYDWNAYLRTAGLSAGTEVVVRQPDYVGKFSAIAAATPVSTWREYLTFRLIDQYTLQLPAAYQQARFDFRGRTLAGQQVMAVRWKRAVDEVEARLGEAAGHLYVEHNFTPTAKARMDALVKNLLAAYRVGVDSLDWMSPATKEQAKAKLAKFTVKIAYPDKWRDYSTLEIRRDDLLGNTKRGIAFVYDDNIHQLGKPVDKSRWTMTPQTVNAYYQPSNNEIVFPAAILQPPFFDPNADDAANYGAIGAVIGHEISHGFDDQGRKSDGDGNLRDWWTPADATAFEARTTKLGAQYNAINPIDDLHINGALTMGENIGDLSGLASAYRAYRISLGGKEAPVIGGFTGDQRFFLGFAQIWRSKSRDDALRQQLLTDSHSPGPYRAFVPLVNNDVFIRAFDVKPGDRMYRAPADRVKIW